MYIPKGWHFYGPVSIIALGFAVNQQVLGGGFHWDYALLVQAPLSAIAYQWGKYITDAGVVWQKYEAGEPTTDKPKVSAVPYNDNGRSMVVQLQQVTEAPRFDPERNFYKTLIDQRNHNLEVNLKESYWIDDRVNGSNRYGAPRDQFVSMRERGMKIGALERAGQRKNSPYTVKDWRVVRLIANGAPLPRQ